MKTFLKENILIELIELYLKNTLRQMLPEKLESIPMRSSVINVVMFLERTVNATSRLFHREYVYHFTIKVVYGFDITRK